jgi:hydrogenase-1 operon protein HyaE
MDAPRAAPDALIEQLATHPASEVVRRSSLPDFLARHPRALLFFTGDLAQNPEGRDVAIVVRELMRQHAGHLALGLVDRRDETAVMAKTGVVVLPAVAFVADGRTVDVVARMRDWGAYAQAADRLFSAGTPST